MAPSTPEPYFDPDEPRSELPPIKKITPAAGFELIDALRLVGIPVRGKSGAAGLFSGGKVNITITVPTGLREEAIRIVSQHFDTSHFDPN